MQKLIQATPLNYDEQRVQQLLENVRDGQSLAEACRRVDYSPNTIRQWLIKGGDPQSRSRRKCDPSVRVEPYYTFARELRSAMVQGKQRTPPGPPRGRKPLDITPEQREAVLRALSLGWSFPNACREAHLPLATFISWLRLGGYPDKVSPYRSVSPEFIEEPYKSFVTDVLQAEDNYFATQTI
jgi:transposase-like protein